MKDLSKIMLLSDIDGTFLDDDSVVVQRNIEAVGRFTDAGGHFAFATGRNPKTLTDVIPNWREIANIPCVISNGGYLLDAKRDEVVHERPLDTALAIRTCVEVKRENPDIIVRYTTRHEVVYVEVDDDPNKLPSEKIYKIVLEGNGRRLDAIREVVFARHGDEFSYSKSCDYFLEFLRSDATKGTMLDVLRDYLGGGVTAYAVGDYENDYDMLCHADVPVCPENGYPMILDYVRSRGGLVLCDNNDGTVAEAIDRIMEIN